MKLLITGLKAKPYHDVIIRILHNAQPCPFGWATEMLARSTLKHSHHLLRNNFSCIHQLSTCTTLCRWHRAVFTPSQTRSEPTPVILSHSSTIDCKGTLPVLFKLDIGRTSQLLLASIVSSSTLRLCCDGARLVLYILTLHHPKEEVVYTVRQWNNSGRRSLQMDEPNGHFESKQIDACNP